MEGSAKETIIIVHGTWAAPEPGKDLWYQPATSVAAAQPLFTAKLDAELQERGSPARCWAHCSQGDQTFQWSGANSWIARTRAASALADYVAGLQKEGWHCHIVTHSHGGNIVVEALPRLMLSADANGLFGKIVTLGTPFIDTMSPILKRAKLRARMLDFFSWLPFVGLALTTILLMISLMLFFTGSNLYDDNAFVAVAMVAVYGTITLASFMALLSRRGKMRTERRDVWETKGSAPMQPRLLAIGSVMDEPWQILHHLQSIGNPLAIRKNLLTYLFTAMRSHISQRAEVSFIHGAKSFRDLGIPGRVGIIYLHLVVHLIILLPGFLAVGNYLDTGAFSTSSPAPHFEATSFVLFSLLTYYLIVLFVTKFAGESFHSAFLSPYRRYARLVGSLGSVPSGLATYIVRRKGWSVLLAMAMGLEGYKYRFPMIEQHPSNLPQSFVRYENMPEDAEQRALAMRNAWIARHFGDVAQTLSKMVVTAADITALLREVEADQSLVHAAYYTDDECIARVADWIAGRG